MRLLIFNWNEALIHSLYKLGHSLDVVGTCVLGRSREDGISTWNFAVRPLLENMRLVVNPEALQQQLKAKEYDLAICFDESDLEYLKSFDIPKIFCPLVSLREKMGDSFDDQDARKDAHRKLADLSWQTTAAYISDALGDPEKGGYPLAGDIISQIICVDEDGYGGYNGEEAAVIRHGNQLSQQAGNHFALQQQALNGLPHSTLGMNPDIPDARPPKSWDDFKTQLRTHRAYFATPAADAPSPSLLNILEAMLIGIPVVTTPHPLGLIEDGVTGFVATDAPTLRQRLQQLLEDRELATRLGLSARKMAIERFPFDDYLDGWEQAIQKCVDNAAGSDPYDTEISLPPIPKPPVDESEPETEVHDKPEAFAEEISLPPPSGPVPDPYTEKTLALPENAPYTDQTLPEPSTVELTIAKDSSAPDQIVEALPGAPYPGAPDGSDLPQTVLLQDEPLSHQVEGLPEEENEDTGTIRVVDTEEAEKHEILEGSKIADGPAFAPTKKLKTQYRPGPDQQDEETSQEQESAEAEKAADERPGETAQERPAKNLAEDEEATIVERPPETDSKAFVRPASIRPETDDEEIAERAATPSGAEPGGSLPETAETKPADLPGTEPIADGEEAKPETFSDSAAILEEDPASDEPNYMEEISTVDIRVPIFGGEKETDEIPGALVTEEEGADLSDAMSSTTRQQAITTELGRPIQMLFVAHAFAPGATQTDQVLHHIFHDLSDRHGDVCRILSPEGQHFPRRGGTKLNYHSLETPQDIRSQILALKPDVILTHQELATTTCSICHDLGRPCVILVSDYQHFGPNPASISAFDHPGGNRFYGSYRNLMTAHGNAIRRAAEVLCTSGHLAGLVSQAYNRATRVWPLPVELPEGFEPTSSSYRKHLVMDAHVSPSGVRLFLDIVRRMPEAPFLITGLNTEYPGLEEMEEIPNLTITPSLPINRGPSLNHLSTARLYIAPSEWPDPDGYTALQAMACGIPVIVPSLGAYPEAVGEAGLIIRQPHDPIAWVEQIFTLLHSRSLYDHFMEQGQTRARKLSLESQAAKLRTVLEMVVARAEAENVMSNK